MIHQQNMYGKDKVEIAIERFKTFEPPEGYYLAFSGGKDSVVIKALADMAGVKYDAHYNVTTVDHPKLVQFIKRQYPDVIFEKSHYKDGRQKTMWNLIAKKRLPPTRIVRYCCSELKEHGGEGRFTVTGVRWAESTKRKNRGGWNLLMVQKQGFLSIQITPKMKGSQDIVRHAGSTYSTRLLIGRTRMFGSLYTSIMSLIANSMTRDIKGSGVLAARCQPDKSKNLTHIQSLRHSI